MEIKFLGTGGAFDYEFGNSSALLTFKNKKILIDCGHTVYSTLRELDMTGLPDYVLITHLHDDHCGSLSAFLLHNQIFHKRKMKVLYPEKKFRQELVNFLKHSLQKPEERCEFVPLSSLKGTSFFDTRDLHVEGMQTYGYCFEEADKRIVYSGDLGDALAIFHHLQRMQEMDTTIFHDISFEKDNPAHAYYKDIEEHLFKYRVLGYHCDARQSPPDNAIPLVQHRKEYLYAPKLMMQKHA